MALRNQPYLPLYVDDVLTDEKLIECSAAATGIYMKLLCILHKQENYGKILLGQKDKQSDNVVKNFAYKISKFLPFKLDEIEAGIAELLQEKVIQIDGDELSQKRMVKDNSVSISRSKTGKKGGKATKKKFKDFARAKDVANTVNENTNENGVNTVIDFQEGGSEETKPEARIISLENQKKIKMILADRFWIEQTTMHLSIDTYEDCHGWLSKFITEISLKEDIDKPLKDIRSHFINWVKIEIEKTKKNTGKPERNSMKPSIDMANFYEQEEIRKDPTLKRIG